VSIPTIQASASAASAAVDETTQSKLHPSVGKIRLRQMARHQAAKFYQIGKAAGESQFAKVQQTVERTEAALLSYGPVCVREFIITNDPWLTLTFLFFIRKMPWIVYEWSI
jgi:hypothetical protein